MASCFDMKWKSKCKKASLRVNERYELINALFINFLGSILVRMRKGRSFLMLTHVRGVAS